MKFSILILGLCSLFVVSTMATEEQSTPFWDMIPLIAQGKSLIQLIFGDKEGAVKTQEHFLNEGVGSSQLRSLYFLVTGDGHKALDIQKKSFSNLEGILDGMPIVGHVKGGIHLLAGDHEHGWSALKSATSTTGTIVGSIFGGPAGAIGGHLLTDTLITGTDAILNGNQSQPHGLVDYVLNIHRLKPGEHFDVIAGLLFDTKAGKKVKNKRDWFNIGRIGREESADAYELQPLLEKKEIDKQKEVGMPNKLKTVPEEPESKINEPGSSKTVSYNSKLVKYDESNALKFKAFKDFLQHDPTYKDFGLHKVWSGEAEVDSLIKMNFDGLDNYQYNYYLDNLHIDFLTNKLSYLTDDEKSLITKHDFRTINTDVTKPNCLSCSFAGIMNLNLETVRRYIKENLESYNSVDEYEADLCLESLRKRKLIKYTTSHRLTSIQELNMYLKSNALKLENKHILLEEIINDESHTHDTVINGHSVIMKFKMVEDYAEPVKLIVDYQHPGFIQPDLPNPYRFQPFIDTNTYNHFYVNAIEVLKQ